MEPTALETVVSGITDAISTVAGHTGTVIVAALSIFVLIWGVKIILRGVKAVS